MVFFPTRLCCLSSNKGSHLWLQLVRARPTAGASRSMNDLFRFIRRVGFFRYLPRCDPHDMERVADDIGGALLASGASGHSDYPNERRAIQNTKSIIGTVTIANADHRPNTVLTARYRPSSCASISSFHMKMKGANEPQTIASQTQCGQCGQSHFMSRTMARRMPAQVSQISN
jgi:hypothetical protein